MKIAERAKECECECESDGDGNSETKWKSNPCNVNSVHCNRLMNGVSAIKKIFDTLNLNSDDGYFRIENAKIVSMHILFVCLFVWLFYLFTMVWASRCTAVPGLCVFMITKRKSVDRAIQINWRVIVSFRFVNGCMCAHVFVWFFSFFIRIQSGDRTVDWSVVCSNSYLFWYLLSDTIDASTLVLFHII